ncbi:MAG: VOC family protein [Gemmatimonadaceae bacterium]
MPASKYRTQAEGAILEFKFQQDLTMSVVNAPFTIAPPNYQLPIGLTLGSVVLQVASLDQSIRFYERVIGLEVLTRTNDSASLGTSDGHELVRLQEKAGVQPVPPRGRLGLYHFAILLPSRSALGQFVAHLRDIGFRAGMSDHLVSEAVYLDDVDGLGIEVYADRPRDSWKLDGTAIAMATDPLDVESLIAAGIGTPWAAIPNGSQIGHVHLYVRDLTASARFYHEALGLDRVTLQFPGALFMSAGGYHHHLGTNIWAAGSPVATAADARLLEWTLRLPLPSDVVDVAQSLASNGNAVTWENGDVVATDPWGTNVRISSAP